MVYLYKLLLEWRVVSLSLIPNLPLSLLSNKDGIGAFILIFDVNRIYNIEIQIKAEHLNCKMQ